MTTLTQARLRPEVETFLSASVLRGVVGGRDTEAADGATFTTIDNIAAFAELHGLAATVTDSTVRDSAGMAELSMPVYARGTAVRLPLNMEPIALDVPVVCGGAQVRPGDAVIGCEDGVLVVPESGVDDVLYQLEDVAGCERDLAQAIRNRASLDDIEAILKRKKALRQR